MASIKNPLELYKYLNKSNCRQCMLPSCMAFAVAVIQGQKALDDCPHLDGTTQGELSGDIANRSTLEDEQQKILARCRQELSAIDLVAVAGRLDAPFTEGMIVVNCLGKEFRVDATGEMVSECHKNSWVHLPLLNYILHGKGLDPAGHWLAFGDLTGAGKWNRFFSHRCELEMRRLADSHTDLFFEILHLFGAKPIAGVTNADYSLVIHPLPKVPFLINYWRAEDAFEAKLNILFDRTAPDNITAESLYLLGRGLVEMFRT
jgi:hypothetical protein